MFKKLLNSVIVGLVFSLLAHYFWGDLVTSTCIGIIWGFFAYFLQEIWQLRNACVHLENIDVSSLSDSFSGTTLNDIANKYLESIVIDVNNTKKTNIPAMEFFNMQTVAKLFKVNLKALDAASGILVGLGLMGTFLGLTIGIANFDSSNSENIQKSIQTLLNGMYIAFLTSLVGMGTSILNTGLDKHWRNNLQSKIKDFTDRLDALYYIDDMGLLQYRQQSLLEFTDKDGYKTSISSAIGHILEESKSQTTTLSSFNADFDKLAETVVRQQSLLEFTDEDGNKASISSAIGHILEENKTQTAALSSFNTDLSTMLNNSLGEQIDQKLSPKMNAVIEHIDKLAETVVSPANDMMEKVASELKDSMALIVNEFKQKVSDTATQQLDSISQSLTIATKAIDVLPENVSNAINSMQEAIATVEKSMLSLTEDIMSKQADLLALQESTTKESNKLIEELKAGIDRLDTVNGNYADTIDDLKKAQSHIEKSLDYAKDITENMQKAVFNFHNSQTEYAENMKQLQIQSQGSIDSVSQLIRRSGEMSQEYASQFSVIKEGLSGIFESMKEGLEEYSKTMQQTTRNYLQQYSQSLTETADSLKTSIDMMSDAISDLNDVVEKNKQ